MIRTKTIPNFVIHTESDEIKTGAYIYDNAKNHFLGQFPSDLPTDQAYVHIGIFLGWMVKNRFYSDEFLEEAGHQIIHFMRKEISCVIFSELWDGSLEEFFFNEEGNEFARYYYKSTLYLQDYQDVLCQDLSSIYYVKDTWENFDLMAEKITARFEEWKTGEWLLDIPKVRQMYYKPLPSATFESAIPYFLQKLENEMYLVKV